MIYWLFKEWFFALEAKQDPRVNENFTSIFNHLIMPFLEKLLEYAKKNPSYMEPAVMSKLENYIGNPLGLFEALQEMTESGFFRTLYNDKNYQLGYTNAYAATTQRYLHDGTRYKFENYSNFDDYLKSVGLEKTIYNALPKQITNLEQMIKYVFHDTFVASFNRESERFRQTPSGDTEGGQGTGIDFSDADLVTRRRASESEAVSKIGPIYECIRKLYDALADKLRDECLEQKEELDNILSDPKVAKNLGNMKKTLHKLLVAKFISGKKPTKTDAEEAEDYLTDMDFTTAQTPTYRGELKTYTNNMLKSSLLKQDKVMEFLDNQKFQDQTMDQAMRNVVGYLYYVGLLKELEKNPENPKKKKDVSPQEKRDMRSEFISLLPDDLKETITNEKLQEFSTMSPKTMPAVSYPVSMEDLRNKGFEEIYKQLMLSFEFPTPYTEYKKDKFGGVDLSATKDDIMNKFLEPIFEVLINKSVNLRQFFDEEEEEFSCTEFLKYFNRLGII